MGKSEAVTAALDAETLADLRRLAAHMNCSVDHLVTTAVVRFVNEEIGAVEPDPFAHLPAPSRNPSLDWEAIDKAQASFHAWLKEGEDDLASGNVVSHEDLMAELKGLDDRAVAKATLAKKQAA